MLIPELLIKTADVFSVCCGSTDGEGYVFVLEQTDDSAVALNGIEMPKVRYRIWRTHRGHPTFELVSQGISEMPQADSASLQMASNQISILFECNRERPAVLAQWEINRSAIDLNQAKFKALGMTTSLSETVRIEPAGRWSTLELQDKKWLFHPRLSKDFDAKLIASFNTADARAIIWDTVAKPFADTPSALIPATLDPVILCVGRRKLVAWRRPTLDWSVYFNSRSYSLSGGTIPLPLFLSELRGNRLVPLSDTAQDDFIAKPMVFEAATDGVKKIIFALIEGTFDHPLLRLILTENEGAEFREVGQLKLEFFPTQISVALYPGGAIVGLFTPKGDATEVESIQISL